MESKFDETREFSNWQNQIFYVKRFNSAKISDTSVLTQNRTRSENDLIKYLFSVFQLYRRGKSLGVPERHRVKRYKRHLACTERECSKLKII